MNNMYAAPPALTPPWQTRTGDTAAGAAPPLAASPSDSAATAIRTDQVDQAGSSLTTLADALRYLWDNGGWDGTLAPPDAWRRSIGAAYPYPDDPTAFASVPTFGPLDGLLRDETITDIHLNGPGREVLVRHAQSAVEWTITTAWHPAWFDWLVMQCLARGQGRHTVQQLGGTADATGPGRRPCTLRYEILKPPVCVHGPLLSLRVLRPGIRSLARLVDSQMLPESLAIFLDGCIRAGENVVIVGEPGSGKTTLARALLAGISEQRIITLEDVPELLLPGDHAVQLLAVPDQGMTLLHLTYTTLRMNPHRVVLGEVRGAEAYALLAAMRSGVPILTTIHGDTTIHGLEAFIGMALEAPEARASQELVLRNLSGRACILVVLRHQQTRRFVTQVSELRPQAGMGYPVPQDLYRCPDLQAPPVIVAPPSTALLDRLAQVRVVPGPDGRFTSDDPRADHDTYGGSI